MLGEQREGQLPDDAAFRIPEGVELVLDDHGDAVEVEVGRPQQAIEEDLGHHHPYRCVRIDLPVPGDQAHTLSRKAPAHGGGLHLAEFLLGQGDEGRRVVGRAASVKSFEKGPFGDQGLAGAGGRRHQQVLPGGVPSLQSVPLKRIGFEGKRLQVLIQQLAPPGRGSLNHRPAGSQPWTSPPAGSRPARSGPRFQSSSSGPASRWARSLRAAICGSSRAAKRLAIRTSSSI